MKVKHRSIVQLPRLTHFHLLWRGDHFQILSTIWGSFPVAESFARPKQISLSLKLKVETTRKI